MKTSISPRAARAPALRERLMPCTGSAMTAAPFEWAIEAVASPLLLSTTIVSTCASVRARRCAAAASMASRVAAR